MKPHEPGSARELLSASLGAEVDDPWQRIEELREAGKRKARAKGMVTQLEHERKIVLADVRNRLAQIHAQDSVTEARLERLARGSDDYKAIVKSLGHWTSELAEAESEYWAMRSELEWDRAAIAHLNAMSRLEEPS